LAAGRSEIFWKAHDDAENGPSIFSNEFKDLFVKMTNLNPKCRLTIEQIMKHPWMQNPRASSAEIKKEFALRKVQVDEVI
jgi:serine/threonine protein kinase